MSDNVFLSLRGISDMIFKLFDFVLPFGITFGSLVIAIFGLPILVRAFRKLF